MEKNKEIKYLKTNDDIKQLLEDYTNGLIDKDECGFVIFMSLAKIRGEGFDSGWKSGAKNIVKQFKKELLEETYRLAFNDGWHTLADTEYAFDYSDKIVGKEKVIETIINKIENV